MNADEASWVESGFEARDGLLLEPVAAFAAKRDVIVLGFSVIQLADWDHVDARTVLDHDAFEILTGGAGSVFQFSGEGGGARFTTPGFNLAQRGAETVGAEGLQQVVDRSRVEGAHGVLVECRHEYDGNIGIDQL